MKTYFHAKMLIQNAEAASEFFQAYDTDMEIYPGHSGKLHYQKKFFMLGKSFVSFTISHSGWGYKMRNETDGFLITIPHMGGVSWKTSLGKYKASAGSLAVSDMREISISTYAEGITYTTIYIDNSDFFKYLSALLGAPPKTRIHFDQPSAEVWKVSFIIGLSNTILGLENSNAPLERVASSLKESLIGFLIYNFKNNYSRVLHSVKGAAVPTPSQIRIAAEYMISNVEPDLTVVEVAIFSGISVRSLQTGFKRYKNMTPIQFLRSERLRKSREIILKGDALHTPREVACQVGFLNYYVFCQYYIQAFGEHPNVTFQKAKK